MLWNLFKLKKYWNFCLKITLDNVTLTLNASCLFYLMSDNKGKSLHPIPFGRKDQISDAAKFARKEDMRSILNSFGWLNKTSFRCFLLLSFFVTILFLFCGQCLLLVSYLIIIFDRTFKLTPPLTTFCLYFWVQAILSVLKSYYFKFF